MKTETSKEAPKALMTVALENILESDKNARTGKHEDVGGLAASIEAVGLQNPLVVRRKSGVKVELICGHRRLAALRSLKRESAQVFLYEKLTDQEAAQIAMIENLQRMDLHPMDEARGLDQLLKMSTGGGPAMTVEQIATKVGKPLPYIKRVLKLLNLTKEGQEAFRLRKFGPEVALALSRVNDHTKQAELLKEVSQMLRRGNPESYIAREINQNGVLDLSGALFPTADATLVPKAGPCTVCPKRSGNQAELFAKDELGKGDKCTDPGCFAVKTNAFVERRKEQAKKAGMNVIEGKAANNASDRVLDMTDTCHQDAKRREWREILKGVEVKKTLLVKTDYHGDIDLKEVVYPKDAIAALKADGQLKLAKGLESGNSGYVASGSEKAERKRILTEKKVFLECLQQVAKVSLTQEMNPKWIRSMLAMVAENSSHLVDMVICKALGLEPTKQQYGKSYSAPIRKYAAGSPLKAWQIAVMVVACDSGYNLTMTNDQMKEICKLAKVDVKKVRKAIAKACKVKKTTKTKAGKKKGKK